MDKSLMFEMLMKVQYSSIIRGPVKERTLRKLLLGNNNIV